MKMVLEHTFGRGIILLACGFVAGTAHADKFGANNPAVVLSGAWTQQTDSRATSGGYAVSNTAGNTATIQFAGDSITLWRRLDTDGGSATISVDSKMVATFNFYFQEQRWQVPAVLERLGPGQHMLVLTVGDQTQMPPGSTGLNVYIDAFEVPSSFTPSANQQAALTRVNLYRTKMGLPPAGFATGLNLAAQAHADYNAMTGILSHNETFGMAGFVGAGFGDRAAYFGYDSAAFEDAHQVGDANKAVDGWMNTLYHRVPIAGYRNTDIGSGLSLLNNNRQDVMDFGSKSGTAPAARMISTYPVNNQTDVLTSWFEEGPDPLPGKPRPIGYALTVHIAQPANVAPGMDSVANSGTLIDANNQNVPVYFMDRTSDPNRFLGDDYAIVPQQPLNVGAMYTAHVTGTDTQGNMFDTTWTFTTLPAAGIVSVLPFGATSTSIWIQWVTAGPVTSTQLQYGTTTAYGMTAMGTPNDMNNPNSVAANLTGLMPGTTYHYQITATDAQGNTRTADDATFITTSALGIGCPASTVTVNTAYSSTLMGSGGVLAYTYSISGSLPHNLNLNTATGAITGTPDTTGTSNFTAMVTDSAGGTPETATAMCSITVNTATQAPAITSGSSTTFKVGTMGSFTVTASGVPTPSITRGGVGLPSAVTFVDNGNGTGTLSGTPGTGTVNSYAITFTANNVAGSTPPQNFTLTVNKGDQTINFTSTPPASAQVGGPTYNVTATASSGLTVAFTIDGSASSVCSISGSTVSFTSVGTCVIDANQAGNANYNAAPQAQQTFVINVCRIEAVPGGSNLSNSVPASGTPVSQAGSFMVSAGAGCTMTNPWIAASNSFWLTVTAGATGNASIATSVAFNALSNATSSSRTGTITVTPATGLPVVFSVAQPGSTAPLVDLEVTALYQGILGRDPDTGGYAFWTGQGQLGLGLMADAFFTSPESFNTNFAVIAAYQAATGAPPTFAQFVPAVASIRQGTQTIPGLFTMLTAGSAGYSATTLYQSLLNRAPGSSEAAACIAAGLSSCFETIIGYQQTNVPIGTAVNEWQSTCGGSACIGVGSATHPGTGDHTNALYIHMLYFTILQRDGDLGGLTFWLGIANSGGAGILFQGSAGSAYRNQILGTGVGFIGSPEFQNR